MQCKILFLLLGGLSITTAVDVGEIEADLRQFLSKGEENLNPIDSNNHFLKLIDNRLGSTKDALVYEGLFDNHQKVAIKISRNQSFIDEEMVGYRAMNAMSDPDIEKKGIPKIYYTGHIFSKHPVIVMSLFDESLHDRWLKQNKSFNAYTILEVLLQMTNILIHLKNRGVVHNDIKPRNIFLRGSEIFLGDFDVSTLKGRRTPHGSYNFASSGFYRRFCNNELPCTYMDDLESLVYSIWYLERINYQSSSGSIIDIGSDNKRFVKEKCAHFENFPRSFNAMKFICYDEILSGKPEPDYEGIVDRLIVAKAEVTRKTGQTCFEWLETASSASSTSSASSATSLTFGYPGEIKPDGKPAPRWTLGPRPKSRSKYVFLYL